MAILGGSSRELLGAAEGALRLRSRAALARDGGAGLRDCLLRPVVAVGVSFFGLGEVPSLGLGLGLPLLLFLLGLALQRGSRKCDTPQWGAQEGGGGSIPPRPRRSKGVGLSRRCSGCFLFLAVLFALFSSGFGSPSSSPSPLPPVSTRTRARSATVTSGAVPRSVVDGGDGSDGSDDAGSRSGSSDGGPGDGGTPGGRRCASLTSTPSDGDGSDGPRRRRGRRRRSCSSPPPVDTAAVRWPTSPPLPGGASASPRARAGAG